MDVLYNQIPAHLRWYLIASINYGGGAAISSSIRHWSYPHELCGTKPDISTLGEAFEDPILIGDDVETYGYPHISDSETPAGTNPDISTQGVIITEGATVAAVDSSNTYDVPDAHQDT